MPRKKIIMGARKVAKKVGMRAKSKASKAVSRAQSKMAQKMGAERYKKVRVAKRKAKTYVKSRPKTSLAVGAGAVGSAGYVSGRRKKRR